MVLWTRVLLLEPNATLQPLRCYPARASHGFLSGGYKGSRRDADIGRGIWCNECPRERAPPPNFPPCIDSMACGLLLSHTQPFDQLLAPSFTLPSAPKSYRCLLINVSLISPLFLVPIGSALFQKPSTSFFWTLATALNYPPSSCTFSQVLHVLPQPSLHPAPKYLEVAFA